MNDGILSHHAPMSEAYRYESQIDEQQKMSRYFYVHLFTPVDSVNRKFLLKFKLRILHGLCSTQIIAMNRDTLLIADIQTKINSY